MSLNDHKLIRILTRQKKLSRPILENILVGTLMGTLGGILLRSYVSKIENIDMIWPLFVLIGLSIGIFSGFARERYEALQGYRERLAEEIQKSEKTLIKTEERYRNLIEQANDIIFTLDTENRFVEINGKFEELLGYKREEWTGRSLYDLIASNFRDKAIKFYWETLKGGTPRFELDAICADGHIVSLALANSPVRDAEGEIIGVIGIARDISESKKIEELQNKFIAHVSHELRTPLTAMREFVSLLIDNIPGKLNEEQKEYCQRIQVNIDRLTGIIENLLLISQTDEGRTTLGKKSIDVRELIRHVQDDSKALARKKGIRLTVALPDRFPSIYADPDKIIQVLTNLVGNALNFSQPGGWVKIGAADGGEEVIIWVEDNGIGIAAEDQEKIFDRFQQIRHGHKFGRRGSGLGLAISREIVSLHRGRIWVESTLGEGSKFSFTLPKTLAPKVLLVDDDPDLIEMFKDFLEPRHYRVSTAFDGEEAVLKATKELPDLIITDIVMPKMNGYEAIGRLKENKETATIPIIVLTGYGLDRERLNNLGAQNLPALYKPVSMEEFLKAVSNALGEREKT